MKIVTSVLTIFCCMNPALGATFCPAIEDSSISKHNFVYDSELQKEHQINFAKNNMRLFCEKNMTLRYLRVNRIVNTFQCLNFPINELHKQVQNFEQLPSTWHLSLVPKLELKKTAASSYFELDADFENISIYDFVKTEDLGAYFIKIGKTLDALPINMKADEISVNSNIKKFCYGETLLNKDKCQYQINLIKNKMAPKGRFTDVTDVKLWKRILTTTEYDSGLIQANKLISQNVIKNSNSTDVFNILVQGFKLAGKSDDESIKMSLDILGIMSNHGPNITHYISVVLNNEQFNEQKLTVPFATKAKLIGRIGSIIPYLDYNRMTKNLPLFSYPKNIITDCDNYKSYHFWMAAYLAYSLIKEHNFEPRDAAASAFLSEKIYQLYRDVASDGNQNGAVSGVFQYQSYDPTHQVIRMDLAYAAAGAVHGAFLAMKRQPPQINVNDIIVDLLQKSYPIEVTDVSDKEYKIGLFGGLVTHIFGADPQKIKKYLKWKMMFTPDTAFYSAEKNIKWPK